MGEGGTFVLDEQVQSLQQASTPDSTLLFQGIACREPVTVCVPALTVMTDSKVELNGLLQHENLLRNFSYYGCRIL
jgi:hypothetical protein